MTKTRLSFHYENPLQKKFHERFFDEVPQTSGVYFMMSHEGTILYVGKAKSLRKRLRDYKNAKPGRAPEHIIEMLEDVSRIKWEEHETEKAALLREGELIRAIRPAFNIAGNWPALYFFMGLRFEDERMHFRLSSHTSAQGYRYFGCYKHRRLTKSGYTALLRLLHAATTTKPRFAFPARITRTSPPYLYSMPLANELVAPLESFFKGTSPRLLHALMARLLENENIPPFMYPGLQVDFETAREFFGLGPQATYEFANRNGKRPTGILSHCDIDRFIMADI